MQFGLGCAACVAEERGSGDEGKSQGSGSEGDGGYGAVGRAVLVGRSGVEAFG